MAKLQPAPFEQLVRKAVSNLVLFLDSCLLLEKFLSVLEVRELTGKTDDAMKIDASTSHNLLLLDEPDEPLSLFSLTDHCASLSGKRLLRAWIISPLTNVAQIRARQAAIEELEQRKEVRERFQLGLSKIKDFERTCYSLYKLSVPSKVRIILFQDISTKRLNELNDLLNKFEQLLLFLNPFRDFQSPLVRDQCIS